MRFPPATFLSQYPSHIAVLAMAFFLMAGSPSAIFAQDSETPDSTLADTLNAIPDGVTPGPVRNLTVEDNPYDKGGAILVTWAVSVDDHTGGKVTGYKIERAEEVNDQPGEFAEVGDVVAGAVELVDGNVEDGVSYYYRVVSVNTASSNGTLLWEARTVSAPAGPAKSSAQWFDARRINVFVGVVILCLFIMYYINKAKSGKPIFIRKIAGLEAVDEAVGRATEMGKKIFFIPGTQDMDNVQTIAGVTILGRVAELAAQYDTYLEVPVSRSLVLVTSKEIVKEAYSKAGRPDAFNEDQVHYLTDDQFGYAAAIDGMVVREKPATIFFMGAFYAESLILAETGNSIGAIQIAGTAMPSQLPFFVAACDYTLIGEELFAASAYLSHEPKLLGSLKGQDVGKGVVLVAILVGLFLETFGIWEFSSLFSVID